MSKACLTEPRVAKSLLCAQPLRGGTAQKRANELLGMVGAFPQLLGEE
eukprot:CAMPEP_0195118610 /NCGR_PEP_ID=MMETSP0448-20130528/117456_1 /TAXON_ID=66468 /ORGANISM="Heterocapsa triquestra, Strain CCMP 448" /LENGTH=47 /DNA_ID= /DNA_START= /DNA_END= /DNA_ORIENTATION=